MKKILISFAILWVLALPLSVSASSFSFKSILENFSEDVSDTSQTVEPGTEGIDLPTFADSGTEGAYTVVAAINRFMDFFKLIVAPIAVLMTVIMGVKLVAAGKESEDAAKKAKTYIRYFVEGLLVIFIADTIVKIIFGTEGDIFRGGEAGAQAYAQQTATFFQGVYGLVEAVIATVAVFSLVTAGMRYIAGSFDDDQIGKAKKQITWSLVGLFVVGISEFVAKGILFPDQGSRLGVDEAKSLFAQVTNLIAGTMGTFAFVFLLYAGYLYVLGAQNEDNAAKAKKIIYAAVLGIIVALAAFAFTNTLVTLDASR
jgi:hypothetical protein